MIIHFRGEQCSMHSIQQWCLVLSLYAFALWLWLNGSVALLHPPIMWGWQSPQTFSRLAHKTASSNSTKSSAQCPQPQCRVHFWTLQGSNDEPQWLEEQNPPTLSKIGSTLSEVTVLIDFWLWQNCCQKLHYCHSWFIIFRRCYLRLGVGGCSPFLWEFAV